MTQNYFSDCGLKSIFVDYKKTGPPVETGRPNDCYTKYLNYKLRVKRLMKTR
jgi:hypothetical protein